MKNFPNIRILAAVFLLFIFYFLFSFNPVSAQIPSFPNLETLDQPVSSLSPQPIQDILGTAKKIGEKLQSIPFFTGIASRAKEGDFKPENILSDFKGFWDGINNWFTENIGVSLREIVQVIGNLILWILEFVINLIKLGLGYVTNL